MVERRKLLGAAGLAIAASGIGGYHLLTGGDEDGAGNGYSTPDTATDTPAQTATPQSDPAGYDPADYFSVQRKGTITNITDDTVPRYRVEAKHLEEFSGKIVAGLRFSPFKDGEIIDGVREYAREAEAVENWSKED